ncbi:concanavalin A-like lectin/glucanase domain-containing protein [Butyriboletus roseoflavus]|nr:concanavalin A-like lectin/glucanase domain-containing protein [Butyriboletus roseoflavus]
MITARVTVPRLTGADGTVVISVGLDGGCPSGSIGMAIQGRYTRGVSSWYGERGRTFSPNWFSLFMHRTASSQWSPAHPINFSLPIKTGDMIKFTVFAFSATVGVVIYENESTGLATAQEYTTDQPLCMYSAGWVVRGALDDMGQFLPLANFGTVDFVDAMALASNTHITDFPGGPSWYTIYSIRGRITPIQASGPTLTIKQI